MSRGGKAGGHAHALGQLRDHFAERGVLAAGLDVGHAQFFKRNDQCGRFEELRHGKAPKLKTGTLAATGLNGQGTRTHAASMQCFAVLDVDRQRAWVEFGNNGRNCRPSHEPWRGSNLFQTSGHGIASPAST
jgi:hypothetical protein